MDLQRTVSGLVIAATLAGGASAEVLRWSSQGDIVTFDPYAHTESFTSSVLHHVYEPLVRRAKSLEIEPALATEWEVVEPTRWRFTLRDGVTFHNGNPFTADDVVASFERLMHPDARARGNVSGVVSVEKVDDRTVDFVLDGPYPLLLNDLSGVFIMDREWLEEHDALEPGNITTGTTSHASTHANGTGPFVLESYRPDVATVMGVNEGWWDEPEHNLSGIEFRPITSDATRVAALMSGELDMIAPVPLQDIERLKAAGGFEVVEEPALRLIFLGFNYRDELHAMPGEPEPAARRARAQGALARHPARGAPRADHARQLPHRGRHGGAAGAGLRRFDRRAAGVRPGAGPRRSSRRPATAMGSASSSTARTTATSTTSRSASP